jgi:hypothetical protein
MPSTEGAKSSAKKETKTVAGPAGRSSSTSSAPAGSASRAGRRSSARRCPKRTPPGRSVPTAAAPRTGYRRDRGKSVRRHCPAHWETNPHLRRNRGSTRRAESRPPTRGRIGARIGSAWSRAGTLPGEYLRHVCEDDNSKVIATARRLAEILNDRNGVAAAAVGRLNGLAVLFEKIGRAARISTRPKTVKVRRPARLDTVALGIVAKPTRDFGLDHGRVFSHR